MGSARRLRTLLLLAACASLAGLVTHAPAETAETGPAPADPGPVPWPAGDPPSAVELDRQVAEAIELAKRERAEEFLEAAEPGEQSEHIRVLQSDVDAGRWSPAELFRFGDDLFEHVFGRNDGYGAAPGDRQRRVHAGVRGGPDTFSCADCHSVGGPDGAGAVTQNALLEGDGRRVSSAIVRNPPALLGTGLVQALAAEMTERLSYQRRDVLARAVGDGREVTVELTAKGVAFGTLRALPDGTLDTSRVEGVDTDLVVMPFGWKGRFATLRRFVEDAARIHLGVQSHVLALRARSLPDENRLGAGRTWPDPDGDGVEREIEEGTLTAAAVYLAMLETPVILPPRDARLRDRWAHGSALFGELGCDRCHRRELHLDRAVWEEHSDTTDAAPVQVGLLRDGDEPRGSNTVRLFSDLRRHAMGPDLADPRRDSSGVPADQFLTRPLWGLAETAPYLHDGRAATIPEAIAAHGGEASAARDAFLALSADGRADLHVFLLSLTRAPRVRIAR
jgi:Di-haem oxidoreductase, putative peroxidase